MRFKYFLHLVKKHNKNGFPLRLTVDFDSDVCRRIITHARTHFYNFSFMLTDIRRCSLPVLDLDYFYDEDLDYVL